MNEPSFLDQMLAAPLYLGYAMARIGLPLAADCAAGALAVAVVWGLWRLLAFTERRVATRCAVQRMHREVEVLLADSSGAAAESAAGERVDLLPGVVRIGPTTTPPPPPRPAVRRRGVRVPGRARVRRRRTTSSSDRRT